MGVRHQDKLHIPEPKVNSGRAPTHPAPISRISQSARRGGQRPFYADHADAYDLLITDPVAPWVTAVHSRLLQHGHHPAAILDAGCGTGRHAEALIALGHRADLADASAALLGQAQQRCPTAAAKLVDLCSLDAEPTYDAVTCRGVLNDMTTDQEREAAIQALAGSLRPGGVLFLDVREEVASQARANEPARSRTVTLESGRDLTFTSRTTWKAGLLHVHEQYEVDGSSEPVHYEFTMRPWSPAELIRLLSRAGLPAVEIRPGVGRKTPDRLFVVAS